MRETPRETFNKLFKNEQMDNPLTEFQVCEAYHQARLKLMTDEWINESIETYKKELRNKYAYSGEYCDEYCEGYEYGMYLMRDILLKDNNHL